MSERWGDRLRAAGVLAFLLAVLVVAVVSGVAGAVVQAFTEVM